MLAHRFTYSLTDLDENISWAASVVCHGVCEKHYSTRRTGVSQGTMWATRLGNTGVKMANGSLEAQNRNILIIRLDLHVVRILVGHNDFIMCAVRWFRRYDMVRASGRYNDTGRFRNDTIQYISGIQHKVVMNKTEHHKPDPYLFFMT